MDQADKDYYLKLKVARYYYENEYTQQEIADNLNLSRPTISKILKEAKRDGMVQIKVIDIKNLGKILNIEEKLRDKYGLRDIKIVDVKSNNPEQLKGELGQAAALYFESILKDELKIGISWGTTVKAMVDHLKENKNLEDIQVVTLVGGSGNMESDVHANILCQRLINKYDGKGAFLYAPAIVDNELLWNELRKNKETKAIHEMGRNVDVAIVGIGAPIDSSILIKTGYFNKKEILELEKHGTVGDICSRFFDVNGNICNLELNKRIVGIELTDLKNIDRVIGIAGGLDKIKSILGALRGGFIDVLVTDYATGKAILEFT